MGDHPIHRIRRGRIKAAIWANQTEFGTKYSTSFARLYKADDKWQDSSKFNGEDLLLLAKVADLVHSWISEQIPDEETEPVPTDVE